jgi:hypothetical protein
MDQMGEIIAEALTARGTRDLEFESMLDVLVAGQAAGLLLFSVDVTTVDQTLPLPEWMFRLTDQEVKTVPADKIVPMALDFYRHNASNPELTGARFQVYFDRHD